MDGIAAVIVAMYRLGLLSHCHPRGVGRRRAVRAQPSIDPPAPRARAKTPASSLYLLKSCVVTVVCQCTVTTVSLSITVSVVGYCTYVIRAYIRHTSNRTAHTRTLENSTLLTPQAAWQVVVRPGAGGGRGRAPLPRFLPGPGRGVLRDESFEHSQLATSSRRLESATTQTDSSSRLAQEPPRQRRLHA